MYYVTDLGHSYWERLANKESRAEEETQRWNVMYVVENAGEPGSSYENIPEIQQQSYYSATLQDLLNLGYIAEE